MSKRNNKYFGTDGIRGRVGGAIVNPEFILKFGWALGSVLRESFGASKVLVGKDTRISGYLLESVLESGLSSAGVDVCMLGPMPTPAVSYLTRTLGAAAGVVISASHNPFYDNGIKVFSRLGNKLPDSLEREVEARCHQPMKLVDASKLGKVRRVVDAEGRYIEFCKSTIGIGSNLSGFKLVLDCANGATYSIAPKVMRELGAVVSEIGVDPDGFNINDCCGSTNPESLAKEVISTQADLGIAFDGDGDRVVMVDHLGEVVDGDELLFIIAYHEFLSNRLQGGVIGTVMSNLGLEQKLNELDIAFKRVKVGDKHIIEALHRYNWFIGGESSGHIAHLGITATGDGIVGALLVLNAIKLLGISLHDLKKKMLKYPQVLINIACEYPKKVCGDERIKKHLVKVTASMKNRGRVLIRPSGTEPVVRVMVEGRSKKAVNLVAAELAETVKKAIDFSKS